MARLHQILAASLLLALSTHAISGEHRQPPKKPAEPQYALVEIPYFLPDGRQGRSRTVSLNERGEVLAVGTHESETTETGVPIEHYFIWRRGKVIARLESPDPAFPYLTAHRISNRSEVVGTLGDTDPGSAFGAFQAFVYRDGRYTLLGFLPGDGLNTFGVGLNDLGEVVGYTQQNDIDIFATAFRWFRGRFTRLPIAPSLSAAAIDINNRGQAIGSAAENAGRPFSAFVWSRKGSVRFLETLPGAESMAASAINDRGQIVGTAHSEQSIEIRAVLWEDDSVQELGTLPGQISSQPQAISVFGTAVGLVNFPESSSAAIWKDTEARDLNDLIADDDPLKSRVRLTAAFDINNFGWIVAAGDDSAEPPPRQDRSGYLLIPVWKGRH